MLPREFRGNEKLIGELSTAIRKGNVSHAYIFQGNEGESRRAFALSFFRALMCAENPGTGCGNCNSCLKLSHGNYADLHIVEPEKSSIKVEHIIKLIDKLSFKPVDGDRNLAIIDNADVMTSEAQNKLLKTLEEPHPGTVIVLLCQNVENLIETIRSRCIICTIKSEESVSPQAAELAEEFLRLSLEGPFYRLNALVDDSFKAKDGEVVSPGEFLDGLEELLEGLLTGIDVAGFAKIPDKYQIMYGIECVERARIRLARNVKASYLIKALGLEIRKE